ncbi:MAG: 50S ribosomal protein L27 [bacterium]
MSKAGGSRVNGRNSPGQRLGVKAYDGETVKAGSIIIRQRGTKVQAGRNTKLGNDNTVFSLVPGKVKFEKEGRRVTVVAEAVTA